MRPFYTRGQVPLMVKVYSRVCRRDRLRRRHSCPWGATNGVNEMTHEIGFDEDALAENRFTLFIRIHLSFNFERLQS